MQNQNRRKITRTDYSHLANRMRRQTPGLPSPSVSGSAKVDDFMVTPQINNKPGVSSEVEIPAAGSKTSADAAHRPQPKLINMKLFSGLSVAALAAAGSFWFLSAHSQTSSAKQSPSATQPSASAAITQQPASVNAASSASSNNYQYNAAKKIASYTDSLNTSTLFISEQLQTAAVN